MNTASIYPASDDERLARMLKALGNPIRFRIMQTLAERRSCITQEIVDTTPLAQSTVSQHLKVLREAGMIQGEIEGPATCYCVDPAGVRWLKEQIEGWLPGCCELPEALAVEGTESLRAGWSTGSHDEKRPAKQSRACGDSGLLRRKDRSSQ
jgi:ArsR family transcriptional regulator, arsenate/arsenite/antimonite-responsive transcriptional repressor